MSAEGKIARLRRELAEAEKEAGVPVSGETVAWEACCIGPRYAREVFKTHAEAEECADAWDRCTIRPLYTTPPDAEALRKRVAELESELSSLMQKHNALHINAHEARAEVERLRKDAERYRILRDGQGWPAVFANPIHPEPLRGVLLDSAFVEPALAARKEEE